MISEFTEFSYGFAITHELVLQNSGSVFAAPEFPSLIREGQVGGGYDVRLDFGNWLFLQFKLSEYMQGGALGTKQRNRAPLLPLLGHTTVAIATAQDAG
jgi:hypothetical protein